MSKGIVGHESDDPGAAMQEISANEVKEVFNAVNTLRTEAMIFIGSIAILAIIFFITRLVLNYRKERATEKAKSDRAEKYSGALTAVATAMNTHIVQSEEQGRQITEALDNFSRSSHQLQNTISILIERTSGTINREDSVRIVQECFTRHLYLDICFIVEQSLRHNNYEGHKEYVKRKVKTAMGDAIGEAKAYLSGLKLAEDANKFFLLVPNQPAERFLLCDLVWAEMEPLFERDHTESYKECPEALTQKIEEAFLLIENTISDYLYKCSEQLGADAKQQRQKAKNATSLMKHTTRLMETCVEKAK